MRRLFQECKVGSGNASLLSEALAFAKPEDLKNKEIIRVCTCVSTVTHALTLPDRNFMRAVVHLRNSSLRKYPGHPLAPSAQDKLRVGAVLSCRSEKDQLPAATLQIPGPSRALSLMIKQSRHKRSCC
jgi:hypothetical protein